MKRDVYRDELARLEQVAARLPNTRLLAGAKVWTLALLNLRYEPLMVERDLPEHPFPLVARLIRQAIEQLEAAEEVAYAQGSDPELVNASPTEREEDHQQLVQSLWVEFSPEDYEQRIERFVHRLRVNHLHDGWLEGKRCVDFGCGHGNFAHALLRCGAAQVVGIDYGESSILYAKAARDRLGVSSEQLELEVGSVYAVPCEDASADLVLQNGVFHHLDDEDAAIRELARVVKPGGWCWYYTDGCDTINGDLWDASSRILRDVHSEFVLERLDALGLSVGKRYHLGDGLNALYRHASWDGVTSRLGAHGFGNFRRLVGGFPTDLDLDVIEADAWGREKFGEGDLRLLAQKLA